jgi:sarcosine oxidase
VIRRTYDVAVIGAGAFGSWTALRLAESGARVLLVDAHGPGNSRASSGGETRIIRMSYGADEIYTRSSMRSFAAWKRLSEENGGALFHKTGALLTSFASDPYLKSTSETLTRARVRFEWLDASALAKRFPMIALGPDWAGVFEPSSGVIMARRAVQAVVAQAVRAGARYEQRPARAQENARITVYACGPWLPSLLPDLLGKRIWPTRQPVFFFGAPPDFPPTPAWVAFREGGYSVPAIDGRGFKFSLDTHGARFDPETGERNVTSSEIRRVRAMLARRFPALANAPLIETRVCQYENTSNGDFLIDRHPHREDVWLVGGGSGHGFKHGPYVGEYVASQISGNAAPEPRFSLASKSTRQNRTVY